MKNNYFLLLLLSSSLSYSADFCFDNTTSVKIDDYYDFPSNSYYATENDHYKILSSGNSFGGMSGGITPKDGSVYLYDKVNKKVINVPKKSNEYAFLTKDNKLALAAYDNNYTDNTSVNLKQEDQDKKFFDGLKKNHLRIYDFKTGKSEETTGKFYNLKGELLEPVSIKRNGLELSIISKNLTTGKNETTSYNRAGGIVDDQVHNLQVKINNEKGTLDFYQDGDKKSDFPISKDVATQLASTYSYYGVNSVSPQGKYVNILLNQIQGYATTTSANENNKCLIYNTKEKSFKTYDLPTSSFIDSTNKKSYSSDEKYTILKSTFPNTPPQVINLETGELKTLIDAPLKSPQFNEKNEICGIMTNFDTSKNTGTHRYECYNLDGKKVSSRTLPSDALEVFYINSNLIIERKVETKTSTMGGIFVYSSYGYTNNAVLINPICSGALEFENCNCDLKQNLQTDLDQFLGLQTKLLCQSNYDEKAWDKILPYSNKLKEKDAVLWMKKISKPNSFNPDRDLSVLKTIIDNGLNLKYPNDFKAASISLMLSHPSIYTQLEEKNPKIFDFDKVTPSNDCLSETEANIISVKIHEGLMEKINSLNNISNSNLAPLLETARKYLNEDQKEKLADTLGDKAVALMGQDPDLKNIFSSKVYKFAYNNYKKQLGLDYKDLSDLTVVQDSGKLKIYQLGVGKLDGGHEVPGGFALKLVKSMNENDIPKNYSEKINWNYNGTPFSANVNLLKEESARDYISTAASPDYKSMKSSGGVRGLIIAGSNLGEKLTQDVVGEYLEYYSGQGFEFEEAAPVNNMTTFFASRMTGPERATYLVKEAHSDGDEKNLFRMSLKGKILKGVKTNEDGTKEYIEIVYPGESPESVLLTNKDFGELMKKRESNNDPELVYLNSSCWSYTKAKYEIAAARSKKLIEIPTLTSMETFYNDYHSAMYSVIHGIRTEQPYSKIRENLKTDVKYSSGAGNVVLFPDEEKFKINVSDQIRVPISIDTQIATMKDGKEVPYSIEQDGH